MSYKKIDNFFDDDKKNYERYRKLLFIGIVVAIVVVLADYFFDPKNEIDITEDLFVMATLLISYWAYSGRDNDDDDNAELAIYEEDEIIEHELAPVKL